MAVKDTLPEDRGSGRLRAVLGRHMEGRQAMSQPPPIRACTNPHHPARRHGHYGFGGAHWCSDFNSPLLSEENQGHVERGWIVIYEKVG